MPSYGEKQKPAGKLLKVPARSGQIGERTMRSNVTTIMPTLKVDNIEYKGNSTLLAQK